MKRRILVLAVVVIAGLAVAAVYGGWFRKDSGLQGSGTVEARNIRVGSKVGGRILEVLVREGDHVQPVQTMITLRDEALGAFLAPAICQQAQATSEKLQHGKRGEDMQATSAELAYEEARFRERQVLAPTAATVEVLDGRPGGLIAPNTPVATLLESDQIYVRIYVPETELNRVSVGQKAEIHVDPFQKQSFNGVVEQINQQAEFLPRNVQTREERVHQVFGVKVRIDDPSHRVLPGMSADVRLLP